MDKGKSFKKETWYVAGLFFTFFSLFFILLLRSPLNNSLFGNIDMWFYVWQMNDFFNHTFGPAPFGQILYPSDKLGNIQESQIGIGLIYSCFKFFVKNDIWTFYLLSCAVLSLNGISFYLLASSFKIEKWAAALIAFLFACNNFSFANVENFNAFVLFPGIMAGYALRNAIVCGGKTGMKYMIFSALLAGSQLYFSMYFFVFQFIILGMTVLISWGSLPKFYRFIVWGIILIIMMIPFVTHHQGLPVYLDKYEILKNAAIHNERHSILLFKDFFRVDPGNLIYPAMTDIVNPWRYSARSGFFGISTYLLAFFSIYYLWKQKQKKVLFYTLGIILLAMAISTGPYLKTQWYEIKTPMGFINAKFAHSNSFRHFFRAHLVTIAGTLLLIAFMFDSLLKQKVKGAKGYILLFAFIFSIENISFKGQLFNSNDYTQPPPLLMDVLAAVPEKTNLFFLPSCHQITDERVVADKLNQINREFIYATWKNYIPYNIYNGLLSYVTDEGYENSFYTCEMDGYKLEKLIELNSDIDYFIIANEFMSDKDRNNIIPQLKQYTKLIKVNSDFAVFAVMK